jgi:hypothetical protein
MADAHTLTCASCAAPFQPAPPRGGMTQIYCQRSCQIKAANIRRDAKRRANLSTAVKPSGLPSSPPLLNMSPSVDRALSAAHNTRISALMTLAHSRGGIDPWQIAELAKLKRVSPWAPLRVILGHKDGMK